MPRCLFDENLSPALAQRLSSSFPGSKHVRDIGLRGASDFDIWVRAAADGWILVSKDDDFRQLSFLRGAPPKVIWLVVGNAGTESIAQLLEERRSLIDLFVTDPEESLLVLRLPEPHEA